MARTTQQQLDDVDEAIARAETQSQSHEIEGRKLARANLAHLYPERRRLQAKLAREQRGGGIRVRVGRPSW